jgi:hypothetical protein
MNNRKARRAWAAARRQHIRRGHIYHIEFQHDPGCLIYSPARVCTCDATRVLKDADGRTLATVEGAGPYDPLEFLEVAQ